MELSGSKVLWMCIDRMPGLVNAGKREKSEGGGKPNRRQREEEEETEAARKGQKRWTRWSR
jgi:hypothetical protein